MHDMFWAATIVFAVPTTIMSAVWGVGHQKFGRPAPVRVRSNDVVIIRKR